MVRVANRVIRLRFNPLLEAAGRGLNGVTSTAGALPEADARLADHRRTGRWPDLAQPDQQAMPASVPATAGQLASLLRALSRALHRVARAGTHAQVHAALTSAAYERFNCAAPVVAAILRKYL